MTVQDYLNFITSEYVGQPDFTAMISQLTSLPVRIQDLIKSLVPFYDLDTPPIGAQLDVIGEWVGASRNVSVPDVLFTWDGTDATGWDNSVWAVSPDDSSIVSLPDDVYLTFIRATIAANYWDGTTNGAYEIWEKFLPDIAILIQDFNNMSYVVIVIGEIDSLTKALFTKGYIKLRPEGVQVTYLFATSAPIFTWDADEPLLKGWDLGIWTS